MKMKNKGKIKIKNILAVVLAFTMLLTGVPMSVSVAAAEELSETTEKASDAVKSAGASLGYMLLDAATELGRQNLQQTSIVNDMINSTQNSIFTAVKAVEKKITDIVTDGIYGDFEYTILDNGTAEITGYNGSTSNLEIPLKVDGYTVTIIGYEAFANCNFITDVKIPDSVISIYESAFADCESLVNVSIGKNVSDIAFNAFNGCTLLTCITLPASIKNVEAGTFFGCTSLANIKVNPDNTVYSDVNGVLFNKDKTKIVKYPQGKQDTNYVIPSSVKVIAESSFSGCKALENVTIPDSVNSIESWAFKDTGIYNNSKNWEKGVLYIDKWLVSGEQYFYNELSVKDGIYGIADKAFSDCSVLTNVIFPSSLLYIGNNAFENCSLITDIKANSCIDTIGKAAFSGCSSLQVVKIDGNVDCIGEDAFSGCDALDTVTVSGNVGSIGDYAFNNCDLLTNVTIDGDLKK